MRRMINSEDHILDIFKSNGCKEQCREPGSIARNIVANKMNEIRLNAHKCSKAMATVKGTTKLDHEKNIHCLQKNLEIVEAMKVKNVLNVYNFKKEFLKY